MKTILLNILILILYSCNSVNKESNRTELSDCDKGISKAIEDAEKGQYEILSYGFPYYEDWEFQMFYEKFVAKKYGIEIGNGGCVVYEENECYSDKMTEIVKEKFGDTIFKHARELAKIDFTKEVLRGIKNDSIFSTVDTSPFFLHNDKNLNQYISNKLKNGKKVNGRVQVMFVVEKNGDLSDIDIRHGIDNKFDQDLVRLLDNMPNWNPAIYFDKEVRMRTGITFKIE